MILPTRGSVECEPLLGHELLWSPMFVGHPESGQRTAKWSSWNCAGAMWCCDIGLTCEMFGSTSVKKEGKISLEIHEICRYLYHDPYFPIHIIPYLHWTYPQTMTSTTEHLGENLFMRSSWPKQPIFQEEGIQHVIVIANYKEVRRDNWSFQIWKGLDVGCLWMEMTLISWTVKKHVLGSSRKAQEPRCFMACHTCISEDSGHQVIKSPFKSQKKDFAQVPVWPWRSSFFGLASSGGSEWWTIWVTAHAEMEL